MIRVFPGFLDERTIDTLSALAERQTERAQGVQPDSQTLAPHERDAVRAFEEKVEQVTGCPRHDLELSAKFKLTEPQEDSEDITRHMHRVSSMAFFICMT